jgi:hypothetical protein
MQGGLALLVLVDLGGVARRYFSEDNPSLVRNDDPSTAVPRYEFDTFVQERMSEAGGPGAFRVLPFVPALGLTPTSDGRSAYFYESIGGYHGAKLALFEEFSDRLLYTGPTGISDRALDLLSVRYVIAQGALPGMPAVFQDQQNGALVLENTDAMPRAFLVDSVHVVADDDELVARMTDASFNPRTTAFLSAPVGDEVDVEFYNGPASLPQTVVPRDSAAAPVPAADDTTIAVRLQRFTPREIVYQVRTDRPRFMVFSEVYYPDGWTARVDDGLAPILRADFLFRAVPVPAGRHLVTMRFDPPAHRIGVQVSAITSLIVYLGAFALAGLLWYREGHRTK